MYRSFLKRIADIVFSSFSLLILSPLMLVIAILIRLEDGESAIFRQKRIGKNGAEFEFLKFRSMSVDAANVPKTEAGSLPLTKIGRFIRRTNIDELPQLINILRGEMSIVGPRPALAAQKDLCLMRRENGSLVCTPGLTGLAQVNAYDGMPEREKASWDARYAERVTFAEDVKIVFRTLSYLMRKPPVY